VDSESLIGSLAWLAIGLGYAWSVRTLARMTRASDVRDIDEHDRKLAISVDDVPIRVELRRGA